MAQYEDAAEEQQEEGVKQMDFEQKYKDKLPIQFGALTDKVVEQLKTLNKAIFPVRYNDKFYSEVQNAGEYTQLAYYQTDILIGAICCRIEKRPEGGHKLYIMTIGVLAPYRCCGVGTSMLEYVLNKAADDQEINEAYLHVQTSNTDALNFYGRFGFEQKEKILNYYKRIDPPDCFLLVKTFAR